MFPSFLQVVFTVYFYLFVIFIGSARIRAAVVEQAAGELGGVGGVVLAWEDRG